MRKSQIRILSWVGGGLLLAQPLLWGQKEGAPRKEKGGAAPIRVIYGSAVGYPGSSVELSLYLTAPDTVGSVESELRFSKNLLEFMSVRKSNILESAEGVNLETKVEDDPEEKSRSVLKLSVKNSQNDSKPLPTGLLAFLTFKVSPEAKPGDWKLDHKATVRGAGAEAKPIESAGAEAPVLSIYPKGINPLLSCFFFSH